MKKLGDRPVDLVRLGGFFCTRNDVPPPFVNVREELRFDAVCRYVVDHREEIAQGYYLWLGKKMLEELADEE